MKTMDIKDVLIENFMPYAAYTITSRAITNIEDGLKDVHRRLLWTMYGDKIFNFTKSANITGKVMLIHPHGDSYPTLVRMAQEDTHNHCLIEGKGNFSQHTSRDLQPAASRYTEVKLTKFTQDTLVGLNNNEVEFIDNYDNTKKIPKYIPFPVPNVLLTNNQGIATGMSSNICSFNMVELVEAFEKYLNTGIRVDLYPDFPTKGYIIKNEVEIAKINNMGIGTLKLQGKHKIQGREVIITEIPYTTTREEIIDKILELIKSGTMSEVYNINDTTDLSGMSITIELKRGADINLFLNKLYTKTAMQTSYTTNFTVLVNGKPKVLGVWSILDEWYKIRTQQVIRNLEYKIDTLEKELNIKYGLKKVLGSIDKTIEIIRYSKEEEIVSNLMKEFTVNKTQANSITNMKLTNINKTYIEREIKNIEILQNRLVALKEQKDSVQAIKNIIISEMREIATKYGIPRKSQLIESSDIKKSKEINNKLKENNIYDVLITEDNYIKKTSTKDRSSNRLKEGDSVCFSGKFNDLATVLIFTNLNKCYKIPLSEISECKLNTLGTALTSFLNIKSENIIKVIVTQNFENSLVFIYDNNKISRVDLSSYNISRKIITPAFSDSASILTILEAANNDKIKIYTKKKKVKIISLSELTLNKSRISQGKLILTGKDSLQSVDLVIDI